MMRSLAAFLFFTSIAVAAEPRAPVPLWPKGAPGTLGTRPEDVPTLTPYLPAEGTACGTAIVICPGGGYAGLAPHEGDGYARWLVDPARIGVMGSSAGGHLASTLLTHFDAGKANSADAIERQSSRPDFGILCYAVITMMPPATHSGSRMNLLGPNPSPKDVELLSSERQVTGETPPCFIWCTSEDKVVPADNSLSFAAALLAHHVPFDLHVYEKGPHGLGLGKSSADPSRLLPWTDDLLYWLGERGLLKK